MPDRNIRIHITTEGIDYSPGLVAYQYYYGIPISLGMLYFDIYYPNWLDHILPGQINVINGAGDVLAAIVNIETARPIGWLSWEFDTLVAHGFLPRRGEANDIVRLGWAWRSSIRLRKARTPK